MKLFVTTFLIFSLGFVSQGNAQDKFAEIGTRKYMARENLLTEPQPSTLPEITVK